MTSKPNNYSHVAKTLHWSCSLLTITLLVLGFVATNINKGPMTHSLFFWHKSLGLTLLALMLFRIHYRLTHPYPAPLPAAKWQQYSASFMHFALYALIISTILIGWSMSSLSGHHTTFFGLFNTTLPLPINKHLAHWGKTIHYVIAWILVASIALHALAALYHHVILKDDTIRRMTKKQS